MPEGIEGVNRALGGAEPGEVMAEAQQPQARSAGGISRVGNVPPFIDLKARNDFW